MATWLGTDTANVDTVTVLVERRSLRFLRTVRSEGVCVTVLKYAKFYKVLLENL
ncbi:MAG: hypothetical protein ACO3NK_05435 [Prochlorotrichaceae cyanobacterium]|jgi:hypothetical protein